MHGPDPVGTAGFYLNSFPVEVFAVALQSLTAQDLFPSASPNDVIAISNIIRDPQRSWTDVVLSGDQDNLRSE